MKIFFYRDIINNDEFKSNSLAGFLSRGGGCHFGPKDLSCNLLLINNKIAIFSIDVLYISEEIYRYVCDEAFLSLGLTPEQISVCATHTHSAPNISHEIFGKKDKGFLRALKRSIDLCILNIRSGDCSDNVYYNDSERLGDLIIYRRKIGRNVRKLFLKKTMLLLPNANEQSEDLLKNMTFITDANKAFYLFGLSCHPTFSTSDECSSDFPGEISRLLRESNSENSIFVQGWSGDVRPKSIGSINLANGLINKLKAVFNREIFIPPTQAFFDYFCLRVFEKLKNKKDLVRIDDQNVLSKRKEFSLKSSTSRCERRFYINLHLIGGVVFVVIPAEVSSKYYFLLKSNIFNYSIIPIGCANGMIGYLPYPTQIPRGGYEVSSSVNYGWDSHLSEDSVRAFSTDLVEFLKEFLNDK